MQTIPYGILESKMQLFVWLDSRTTYSWVVLYSTLNMGMLCPWAVSWRLGDKNRTHSQHQFYFSWFVNWMWKLKINETWLTLALLFTSDKWIYTNGLRGPSVAKLTSTWGKRCSSTWPRFPLCVLVFPTIFSQIPKEISLFAEKRKNNFLKISKLAFCMDLYPPYVHTSPIPMG